jgi:hypothetical protein
MHFDLDAFLAAAPNDDAQLARRCVAEGDASFVGYAYSSVFTPSMESWLKFVESRAGALDVEGAPDFVNRRFQLPYLQGARFVALLHRKGGWDAVNAAYQDPPASTEEILHPDVYLAGRDRPVDVRLPPLAPFLGEGWREVWQNSVGELGLRTVLAREPSVASQAGLAAQGWDGDRAVVLERRGSTALAWHLRFDNEKEAQQAFAAYAQIVRAYPALRVLADQDSVLHATSRSTPVWLERAGAAVVVLDGFPEEHQSAAVRAILAQPLGPGFVPPLRSVFDGGPGADALGERHVPDTDGGAR